MEENFLGLNRKALMQIWSGVGAIPIISKYITKSIKIWRLRWMGHGERMNDDEASEEKQVKIAMVKKNNRTTQC